MKKEEHKQPDAPLMERFSKSQSAEEIKKVANKIIDSDPDIDTGKLDEAGRQFHKEKKEDAQKRAQNDAEFDLPKGQ